MKQTAVEWLAQEMDYLIPSDKELLILQIVNKAKEMEKQQQGYSEEEVLPILEHIQWIIRKIDKGNTPEEIVRLLLFDRDKIEQFKNKKK